VCICAYTGVYMCIHIFRCIYAYTHIQVYICVCIFSDVYMCIHIFRYIYVYTHIQVYLCVYTYSDVYKCVYILRCIYVYTYIQMYTCVYTYSGVYMCIHIFRCIYVCTHIRPQGRIYVSNDACVYTCKNGHVTIDEIPEQIYHCLWSQENLINNDISVAQQQPLCPHRQSHVRTHTDESLSMRCHCRWDTAVDVSLSVRASHGQ